MSGAFGRWVAGLGLLLGACEVDEPGEAEVYRSLEGVYEIVRVEAYPAACGPEGTAEPVEGHSSHMAAFSVTEGVPEVQLHVCGCTSPEHCRKIARDISADGNLDSEPFIHFRCLRYSRGHGGSPDGVGATLSHLDDGRCRLDLEQFHVERAGAETLFEIRTREGVDFDADAEGRCESSPELEAQWEAWQSSPCRSFTVIRTRRVGAL